MYLQRGQCNENVVDVEEKQQRLAQVAHYQTMWCTTLSWYLLDKLPSLSMALFASNVQVNNVSVMLVKSQRFLCINQYCGELIFLAQGATSGDGSHNLLIRIQMLYHQAPRL